MHKFAVLSECGQYRYRLTRNWDILLRPATFVMLNPSTADAVTDDATIRRCIGFAKRWSCGGIIVVNLFAFRATDPNDLFRAAEPVGPDNDRYIRDAVREGYPVVGAWGNHGAYRDRAKAVCRLISRAGIWLSCLGHTKDKHPRHPLRLPYHQPLLTFEHSSDLD